MNQSQFPFATNLARRHPPAPAPYAVLLSLLFISAACSRTAPKQSAGESQSAPIVLDYRNGWQHAADGRQTIDEIAAIYERDAELVAQLNGVPHAEIPEAGRRLYIPPTNQRDRLEPIIARVRQDPSIVPDKPWRHKQADLDLKRVIETKHASAKHKQKIEPVSTAELNETRKRVAARLAAKQKAETARTRSVETKQPVQTKQTVAEGADDGADDGQLETPADNVILANKTRSSSVSLTQAAAAKAGGGHFRWPVTGEVVTGFRQGWQKACHGIEIETKDGEHVCAAKGGKVLLAQEFISYGNLVVIDHGDGFATAYGYNKDLWVKEGDVVTDGQKIASVGGPWKSGKPRLFFQIRRDAQPVDPMQYLP